MSKLNMSLYHEMVRHQLAQKKGIRVGQAYFNVLHDLAPKAANSIRNTPMDPFHNDDRLPEFFIWLYKEFA